MMRDKKMLQPLPTLPIVPIKNTVLFPNLLMPLSVGRNKSVAAIQAALGNEAKEVLIVTQRDSSVEVPGPGRSLPHRHQSRHQALRPQRRQVRNPRPGRGAGAARRFHRTKITCAPPSAPSPIPDQAAEAANPEIEALHREVVDLAVNVLKHANVELPAEFARAITGQDDPLQMAWMLASVLSMDVALEHSLLAAESRAEALRLIHAHLSHELQILEIRGKIASKAQNEMGKEQREYVLRQQLRAIQQELGGKEGESELDLLRERLKAADLPDEVRKEADREMSRLDRLSDAGARLQRRPHLARIDPRTAVEKSGSDSDHRHLRPRARSSPTTITA